MTKQMKAQEGGSMSEFILIRALHKSLALAVMLLLMMTFATKSAAIKFALSHLLSSCRRKWNPLKVVAVKVKSKRGALIKQLATEKSRFLPLKWESLYWL